MAKNEIEESIFEDVHHDNGLVITSEELIDAPKVIKITSPEWQSFLMSQFWDDELIEINGKQCPTAAALRRVVLSIVGDIVKSGPEKIIHTNTDPPRTVVHYTVEVAPSSQTKFAYGFFDRVDYNSENLIQSDVASVWELNTDDLFLGYPEETAATRAEGRCYRKLLRFNGVTAEELTRHTDVAGRVKQTLKTTAEKPTDGSFNEGEGISENQLGLITRLAKEMQIDLNKFIDHFYKDRKFKFKDDKLIGVNKGDASKLFIQVFNNFKKQQEIPEEILIPF